MFPVRVVPLLLLLCGAAPQTEPDRSPGDLALSPDGRWVLTANRTSDSGEREIGRAHV